MKEQDLTFHRSDEKIQLTPEQIAAFEKLCNDICGHWGSIKMLNENNALTKDIADGFPGMIENCVLKGFGAYGYAGILKEAEERRWERTRAVNEENRELRRQLGEKVSPEDCRERLKIMTHKINQWWENETGCYATYDKITFHQYGCSVVLCGMLSSRSEGKTKLENLGITIHDENIIDSETNRRILDGIIRKRFPSYRPDGYKIVCYHGIPLLREIKITITNFDEV
ncbi:MAG: hypothetical protein EOM90_18530 [Alphaproteobacteria bacterium]|nr:hypothetical protein [Alphaproteobacteria bacterium]